MVHFKTELNTIESINDYGDITVYNHKGDSRDLKDKEASDFLHQVRLLNYDYAMIDSLCRRLLDRQMIVIKGKTRTMI